MSLQEYRAKRDTTVSGEPTGDADARAEREADARFVVHEHAASTHHYDFRLEVGGVLASWAVPKGPSTDPREKRMALPTEDHPLDYVGFEGRIPEGEYGAGAVIVWDTGTYENLTTNDDGEIIPTQDALAAGHVVFELDGKKLEGAYALTRFRSGENEAWLLVKVDDGCADARRRPTSTQRESVLSGDTVDDVADADDA